MCSNSGLVSKASVNRPNLNNPDDLDRSGSMTQIKNNRQQCTIITVKVFSHLDAVTRVDARRCIRYERAFTVVLE